MSNHSGSYLLNDVLKLMDKFGIFDQLGREKTQQFAVQILRLGRQYDCNNGEILVDIGERVGVCFYCGDPAEQFVIEGYGRESLAICQTCYEEPSDS